MKNYVMALVMILAASGLAFGQVTVEPACEGSCYVAPYFVGNGGFVGEQNMEDDEDTMDEDEGAVTFVVTCGNVTTTGTAAADDAGIVRQVFNEDNGLACGEEDGEIEISNLKPGGWYWIDDDTSSAVSALVSTDVLENAQTTPTDPGGVTISTMGKDGAASFVKHEPSGRVGIIPHILPTVPLPMCTSAAGGDNNCVVNASYSIALKDGADKAVGGSVTRGEAAIVVTPSVAPTGNLRDGEGVTFSAVVATGHGITVASGVVTIADADPTNDKDRCHADNIDRDTPIKVTVSADATNAMNYVPAPGAGDLKAVSFLVVCPAVAAASTQGVELVPENPFPTGR